MMTLRKRQVREVHSTGNWKCTGKSVEISETACDATCAGSGKGVKRVPRA